MAAENFKVKKGLEVGTGITANSDGINVTGIITATQYRGDGSGLTGVVASGTGVIVKDEGSAVGTAGTFNFVGSGVAATLSAGTATVTISSGGLTDIVDDTTPQLGGNLDLNSKFITGTGNIDITGSLDVSGISTTGFLEVGNLTNGRVPYAGSASGRLVDSANLTFDGTNLFVSGINVTSAGTTSTFGADIVTRNFKATGVSTFSGTLQGATASFGAVSGTTGTFSGNITGPLLDISPGSGDDGIILLNSAGGQNNDFSRIRQVVSDDSFRIENKSSGAYESLLTGIGGAGVKLYFAGNQKLTTTINGIEVPDLNVTGVGTVGRLDTNGVTLGTNSTTFAAKFADDSVANFGTDNDMKVLHTGSNGNINNYTGDLIIRTLGSGDDVLIDSEDDILLRTNSTFNSISCVGGEGVELYHYSGSGVTSTKRIETTKHGAIVTGVCTATSFSGSGAGLTSLPSAQLTGALPSLDGSALTGVIASGTGIIVRHDGNVVGTAASINFSTNLDVSPISAGIVTVTASGGSGSIAGISTTGTSVFNEIVVGTGVTLNARGINAVGTGITAGRFHADGGSFQAQIGISNQGYYLYNGASTHLAISYSSSANINQFRGNASGSIPLIIDDFSYISINAKSNFVRLQHAESTKLVTDQAGVKITGVCTATSFSGSLDASNLTGTIANGRFPATLPTTSGANLTNLPVPTQITVADESSDQTCNILFTTAATGDLAPKSSSTLTYDSNGEILRATLFSGSGASLTNLNASNIGSGTMSASRLTGALPAISGASLTNLPAPTPATSDIQVVYEITNQSSFSYFRFAGNGVDSSANNPDIYLTRGQKYRFINNSGGSHPFQIQTTGGSAYTTGVTYTPEHSSGSNSASSGNIDFAIRWDAPSQLKYVCTAHGSMVGNIYIDGGDAERRTTANAATSSIANNASGNISITAAKTYTLLKIQTSAAAWVTLYTDSTSRSNDSSRSETTDPTPGSGVIAEVITTGAATQIMTPGIIGWNNDGTPAPTVYAKVVNKSGSTQAITVTLHYLALEI